MEKPDPYREIYHTQSVPYGGVYRTLRLKHWRPRVGLTLRTAQVVSKSRVGFYLRRNTSGQTPWRYLQYTLERPCVCMALHDIAV